MARIVVGAAVVISTLAAPAAILRADAAPTTVGYRDFSYAGTTAPTADKPQSKLWFHDSRWWGVLFRPTPSGGNFYIHRLGLATQSWVSTGVVVDTRSNVRVDALSKGAQLYVASSSPSADANLDRTTSSGVTATTTWPGPTVPMPASRSASAAVRPRAW